MRGPGAALEVSGVEVDEQLLAAWRQRVDEARAALGWPQDECVARRHAAGATLALAAPWDGLMTATEVAEWSLVAALAERDRQWWARVHAAHVAEGESEQAEPPEPIPDFLSALARLQRLAAGERSPALLELIAAASERHLSFLVDDERLTLGMGRHGATWERGALPAMRDVPWDALSDVPIAVVTGSNGKTTTTRILAACLTRQGLSVGLCSTDGVSIGGRQLASGDYSGPQGARTVLREPAVDVAVLETARGGLLRRGLALQRAAVAIVTNVSPDHFGEYGIHDLTVLAQVKMTVATLVREQGTLVANADDDLVQAGAEASGARLAWFALDDEHPVLVAHRARGGLTCGVSAAELRLSFGDEVHVLGALADLPLTLGGHARYNIANLGAAALAAVSMGVPVDTIAATLRGFGRDPADNRGRLEHYEVGGLRILVDYAHNPEGLQGLLEVAGSLRGRGRLGLLLGQAGNRVDADIVRLADVAVAVRPDRVVLKDLDGYLRGRQPGEVPELLRQRLLSGGQSPDSLEQELQEAAAARRLLTWARPRDVLVMPLHAQSARTEILSLLERLRRTDWQAGQPLP